ncbi:MAG: 2-dehydropantoate 2-reductase [Pseudorhodoplanes sp.]
MQFCIFGAGAGGGHFAVKLARAGHQVSLIARGPHLAAIRASGLRMIGGPETLSVNVAATDDPRELGKQEIVIVSTKATALASVAAQIAPLIGEHTLVIFPQNGMTWWYPLGINSPLPKPPSIPIFDLAGPFLAAMRQDQVLGGIIYSANELAEPGVIKNNSPAHNRLEFSQIGGSAPDKLPAIRQALEGAGIFSPEIADIRASVWTKLLNNMSGSTIALATGGRSDATRADAGLSEVYRRLVREGLSIAAAHGYPLADKMDPEKMLARLLHHKPSLLQDYEARRPMEIDVIVQAPIAFARAAAIATPTLDTLGAIVSKLARDRGLI